MSDNESGQALLETAVALMVITSAAVAVSGVLKAQWDQARCSYEAFDAAHKRLRGEPVRPHFPKSLITIQESDREVTASASCGQVRKVVALPRLEFAKWPY